MVSGSVLQWKKKLTKNPADNHFDHFFSILSCYFAESEEFFFYLSSKINFSVISFSEIDTPSFFPSFFAVIYTLFFPLDSEIWCLAKVWAYKIQFEYVQNATVSVLTTTALGFQLFHFGYLCVPKIEMAKNG